jgi:hypothetical protein
VQQKLDLDAAYEKMTDADRATVTRIAQACAMQNPRASASFSLPQRIRLVAGAARCEQRFSGSQQINLKLVR